MQTIKQKLFEYIEARYKEIESEIVLYKAEIQDAYSLQQQNILLAKQVELLTLKSEVLTWD